MKRTLIVAKYQESLEWLSHIPVEWTIKVYSKDPAEQDPALTKLLNIGREAHTYLRYIIEHYSNLPDQMVFTQGNPLDHAPQFLSSLAALSPHADYEPLGPFAIILDSLGNPHLAGLPPTPHGLYFSDFYKLIMGVPCPAILRSSVHALFAVSKRKVLAYPLQFYQKAIETFSVQNAHGELRVNTNTIESHYFERLWDRIFADWGPLYMPESEWIAVQPWILQWQAATKVRDEHASFQALSNANEALFAIRGRP